MKINPDDMARIANLARIELSPEKLALFAGQLGDVLTYMDALNAVDTADVRPMYSPVSHHTVTRPDTVVKELARADILAGAPEDDGAFFIVPRIV